MRAQSPPELGTGGLSNLLLSAGIWTEFYEKDKINVNAIKLYLNSTKHMILFWRIINIVTAQFYFYFLRIKCLIDIHLNFIFAFKSTF